MIVYDLQCTHGHTFEGWFEDRKAYKDQQKKGLLSCPVCNNTSVSRILSSFAIKKSVSPPKIESSHKEFDRISRKVADYVEQNFDNVGSDFTREALKIHYGVSEPRNIRGVSTQEEEKTLKEEGVPFLKVAVPTPPDTDS